MISLYDDRFQTSNGLTIYGDQRSLIRLLHVYLRREYQMAIQRCPPYDQVVNAQDIDGTEYMTPKVIEEYDKWGLEVNIRNQSTCALEDSNRIYDLQRGKNLTLHCIQISKNEN